MAEQKKEHAKEVNIEKAAVENIYAENVNASKIGARAVYAGNAKISSSGIGFLRGQTVNQESCGNVLVKAGVLKTESVKSLVTVADTIEGDVKTVLDKKGAAVFGLVVGSVLALFGILRRLSR